MDPDSLCYLLDSGDSDSRGNDVRHLGLSYSQYS